MVWVHGFHLLLLPSFLTRVLRTARVGLFLHTPFPSSEIFRTLPFREDLLRGMLTADQVNRGVARAGDGVGWDGMVSKFLRFAMGCCRVFRRFIGRGRGGLLRADECNQGFYALVVNYQ